MNLAKDQPEDKDDNPPPAKSKRRGALGLALLSVVAGDASETDKQRLAELRQREDVPDVERH